MIMNKVGGGGSSGGVTTRTVGLGEIYFPYTTDSTLSGYRVLVRGRGDSYSTIFFPGKVLQILSFKYRFRQSNSSGGYGEESTYTGEWLYFGNMASPTGLSTPSSSNYYYYFAVTELTAIVEDEASGGQVQTITISASDLYDGKRVKLPSNIISVSNLVSSVAIPSGTDSKAALISTLTITGSLLYIKGKSADITLNVKLATSSAQGILVAVEKYYSSGANQYGMSMYTGFPPKFVTFSKIGSSTYSDDGVQCGAWHSGSWNTGITDSGYVDATTSDSTTASLRFQGMSCTYNDSSGSLSISFSPTYGDYVKGSYQMVAVG